jgi:hypothetical protein
VPDGAESRLAWFEEDVYMRSRMLAFAAAGGLVLAGAGATLAQDATPAAGANPLAGLGLPEITVTATDDGFSVSPAEVPAGRYLVTLEAAAGDEPVLTGFVRLVEGKTVQDLSAADEIAAGTPIPEEGFAPETFAWLYETYIAGGPSTVNEVSTQVVLDLKGGDYGVWAEDPMSPLVPGELTVTGDPEAPIAGPEPEASVTMIEEGEGGVGYSFRLEGELREGPQVVAVLNASDQPHFVEASQYPDPVTAEQIMAAAMADPTASPVAGAVDFSRFTYAGWAGLQSTGTTQWVVMDFAAGQAVLACYVPDPLAQGIPHAFEGMLQVFEVTGN